MGNFMQFKYSSCKVLATTTKVKNTAVFKTTIRHRQFAHNWNVVSPNIYYSTYVVVKFYSNKKVQVDIYREWPEAASGDFNTELSCFLGNYRIMGCHFSYPPTKTYLVYYNLPNLPITCWRHYLYPLLLSLGSECFITLHYLHQPLLLMERYLQYHTFQHQFQSTFRCLALLNMACLTALAHLERVMQSRFWKENDNNRIWFFTPFYLCKGPNSTRPHLAGAQKGGSFNDCWWCFQWSE